MGYKQEFDGTSEVFVTIGGQKVLITGDFTATFVDAPLDDSDALDTVAGALIVEDKRNNVNFEQLAHVETNAEGQKIYVTYDLHTAAREIEVSVKKKK